MLEKHVALAAIKVFAGKGFSKHGVGNQSNYYTDAVLELLSETKKASQNVVANETVSLLLDRCDKEKPGLFSKIAELLSLALDISIQYRLDTHVAKRLVHAAARAGFHGRFPDLPLRLLERTPNAEEIILLVDAYVNDLASRCTGTEEKLKGLVRAGLSSHLAQAQLARFDEFDREWKKGDFC